MSCAPQPTAAAAAGAQEKDPGFPWIRALFGLWRIVAQVNSNKLWPLIMVSNKVSLQNQLQNPRASDPEESNEAFDRAIRGWLL